ncbi:dihydroxyacetone kinase subunit DhaK [Halanaerobium congolense]|jgi:dihydroxyacetone kinase-like protein|uniref:Dihydroxyacetone kinase DhaK subunit n=1 Tax=Halanaerobium congolense TaxID=54121 RepID=A0A1G6QYR9_9FIRM|nr:dihydroxyacetone kinase subunit DhaK [Halanaerobium congolense]KXS48970.1 MAG: dihydroxyacetone kinase, N-terminal domain [Halanaerobium sp. T82-1]PUU91128.1 MAG: dihydroxyacetone kinase, N-terminal domain [Halanaerobium sp.]PTX15966.1 dihydroxyacetone kinase DhaK subunit [Halanaerobium congolense]PXV64171.1 dihydroxyacetone kinase DhaK subunit [Halanaerobium congolense]TDX37115.1 dihydroxyacetone kinase DhaK subunit [Halanaerobium congolense]
MKKKLINNPEEVVEEMVEGIVMAAPDKLEKIEDYNIVIRKGSPNEKVALVSGGGSGHEPTHAGFVGKGMLDGAIAGDVFTSPTPDAVFEAIKAVDGGKGVLLVIKNYTGDVMNFEMAAEMAEAEGIEVDQVVVNDDVAVEDSLYTTGRRGVAGTIFVHKIAGAKAEAGAELADVKKVAEKVIANVRTKGMALYPCRVPAADESTFTLEEDEIELGIGIHGEPGTERTELMKADEIVDELLGSVIDDIPYEEGDDVALMINGMGGTPLMELFLANRRANQVLEEKGINIYKTFVGEYMTSLEMAGVSITLLKLDEELKELLDAPTEINIMK